MNCCRSLLWGPTGRRLYRTDDGVKFVSRAAGAYDEVKKSVAPTRVHPAKHFEKYVSGEKTSAPVDAEAAWKYVMENPTGAQKDTEKSNVNPVTGEVGGYANLPEPTRFGDWEKNGICYDF